MALWREISK